VPHDRHIDEPAMNSMAMPPSIATGRRHEWALNDEIVHAWTVSLDLPSRSVKALGTILSPEEADRASRFAFKLHRERFMVGRARIPQQLWQYATDRHGHN
jgi:hypothetical protein